MALRNQWVRLSVILLIALLAKVVLGNPFGSEKALFEAEFLDGASKVRLASPAP